MANRYARGGRAWGKCDRCGLRAPLVALIFDAQYPNLRVHSECWDMKHPQERLRPVTDAIALWKPRPEDYPYTAPGLTAEQEGAGDPIVLTWTAASSPVFQFNGYQVYRALNDGEFELIATLPIVRDFIGTVTTETLEYEDDTEFDEDDEVNYYVIAYAGTPTTEHDPGYVQAQSNTVTITYVAPPALTLTATLPVQGGPVQVEWDAVDFGEATNPQYRLYRSINGGPAQLIATLNGATTNYEDGVQDITEQLASGTYTVNAVSFDAVTVIPERFGGLAGFGLSFAGYYQQPSFGGTGNAGSVNDATLGSYSFDGLVFTPGDEGQSIASQLTVIVTNGEPIQSMWASLVINSVDYGRTNQGEDSNDGVTGSSTAFYGLDGVLEHGQAYTVDLVIGSYVPVQDQDEVTYYVVASADDFDDVTSNEDSIIYEAGSLSAPVLVADQPVPGGGIILNWTAAVPSDPGDPVLSYDIYLEVNGGGSEYLDTVGGGILTYQDDSAYNQDDEIVYTVIAYTTYLNAESNPDGVTYEEFTGITAEQADLPGDASLVGFAAANLLGEGPAIGELFGDLLPGHNIYAIIEFRGNDGLMVVVRESGGGTPPANLFSSITINGQTLNTAGMTDVGDWNNITFNEPETAVIESDVNYEDSRVWFWPGLVNLEDAENYQVEFA